MYTSTYKLKINFTFATGLEILKIQKTLWVCLEMPDHAHLKLYDRFATSMDVSPNAKNNLIHSTVSKI